MAWLAQLAGLACIFAVATSKFGIIFGSMWLFIVIAQDIQNDMAEFNQTVKTPNDDDCEGMAERFRDIVQLYSDAKE